MSAGGWHKFLHIGGLRVEWRYFSSNEWWQLRQLPLTVQVKLLCTQPRTWRETIQAMEILKSEDVAETVEEGWTVHVRAAAPVLNIASVNNIPTAKHIHNVLVAQRQAQQAQMQIDLHTNLFSPGSASAAGPESTLPQAPMPNPPTPQQPPTPLQHHSV